MRYKLNDIISLCEMVCISIMKMIIIMIKYKLGGQDRIRDICVHQSTADFL